MAVSYAFFGPEQTNVSLPALITLALPDTGAARYWISRLPRISRNSAEPSREIEEHSISIFGFDFPFARRFVTTCFTSFQAATMQKTTSREASSEISSATLAPHFFS